MLGRFNGYVQPFVHALCAQHRDMQHTARLFRLSRRIQHIDQHAERLHSGGRKRMRLLGVGLRLVQPSENQLATGEQRQPLRVFPQINGMQHRSARRVNPTSLQALYGAAFQRLRAFPPRLRRGLFKRLPELLTQQRDQIRRYMAAVALFKLIEIRSRTHQLRALRR